MLLVFSIRALDFEGSWVTEAAGELPKKAKINHRINTGTTSGYVEG